MSWTVCCDCGEEFSSPKGKRLVECPDCGYFHSKGIQFMSEFTEKPVSKQLFGFGETDNER